MFSVNSFSPYGGFSLSRWFVDNFKVLPNRILIKSKKEDGISFNEKEFFSKFQEKYPDLIYSIDKLSSVDKEPVPNYDPYEGPKDINFMAFNFDKRVAISTSSNQIEIAYFEKTEYIDEFYKFTYDLSIECKKPETQKSKVNLITFDGEYYELTECQISSKYPVNVNKHYNDDFKQIDSDVNAFLNDTKSGLVIFHGDAGTSKTTYIRHLINNHDKSFIIMNNSMMNSISDPVFMKFILNHKNSILILEDCEQLLEDRSSNAFNNGIANILNMTDGLYSDILNIKIIATFNCDISKIDPALLRKGRLVAKYEFKELCLEKTNSILKELGKPESKVAMTLAQIYNYDDVSYEEKKKEYRPIGFGHN